MDTKSTSDPVILSDIVPYLWKTTELGTGDISFHIFISVFIYLWYKVYTSDFIHPL